MRITPEVREAIRLAAQRAESNAALGALAGLHGATIGQYLSGKITTIKDDAWERLLPLLGPYLALLQELDNPLHPRIIQCRFVHDERKGLFAIGHERDETTKEARLYIWPDKLERVVVLLTVGLKDEQQRDIRWCHSFMGKA